MYVLLYLYTSTGISAYMYIVNLIMFSLFFIVFRDAIIILISNIVTGLLASIAVFSVLGFLSKDFGIPIADVTKSGENY